MRTQELSPSRSTGVGILTLLGLSLLLSLTATGQNRPFIWKSDLTYSAMLRQSPLVLVGDVLSIDFVGPTVKAKDDRAYESTWQLVKVRAQVESVLRGVLKGPTVEFYYYTSLGPISGDSNSLNVGDKCVFFLLSEHGSFRAVRDFWRSSIEIGSGTHRNIANGGSIETRVAEILLTPGEGLDPARFTRYLPRSASLAEELEGQCETLARLRALQHDPNQQLRQAVITEIENRQNLIGKCQADRVPRQQ